jgi:hypothetical protein
VLTTIIETLAGLQLVAIVLMFLFGGLRFGYALRMTIITLLVGGILSACTSAVGL